MFSPFNTGRSDQLSRATSSIVHKTANGRIDLSRMTKKRQRERVMDRGVNVQYFDTSLAKLELLAVSSGSPRWQEFSFNILSEISVRINLASSHLPSDHVVAAAGVRGAGVVRWATKHEAHRANGQTDLQRN